MSFLRPVTVLAAAMVCVLVSFAPANADQSSFVSACLETAHKYFIALDERKADAVAELFTDDGLLVLPSQRLSGPKEIGAYVEASADGPRQTFHHLTTHRIEPTEPGKGRGTIYVLLNVSQKGEGPGETPLQTALVSGTYTDEYVVEDGVCKIQNRQLDVVMINQGSQP